MKLVHLSDLHLGTQGELVLGRDVEARVAATFRRVAARHADAALCLISGDLAHRGDAQAYATLAGKLPLLGMPVALAMGNHDDRDAAAAPLMLERDADGHVQYVRDLPDGWRLIVLDTNSGADSVVGTLCGRRLDWFAAALAQARGARLVVAMHHPPCAVGIPALDPHAATGGDTMLRLLREAGGGHVLYGHHHRPSFVALAGGVTLSTVPAVGFQFALELERMTVTGVDEPAACAVVLADADSVVVHLDHIEADPVRFPLGGGPPPDGRMVRATTS